MFSQSSHVYGDVSHAKKRAPGRDCISTAWPVGAAHTEGDQAQDGSVNLRRVRWFTQEAETEVMTHVTEEWRRTDTQALKTHRHCRHTDATDTTVTERLQMLQTQRVYRHYRHTDAPGHL